MLEDLHWADAPSLQLLRLLTSRLNGRHLGIVITARTWEIESDPELDGALGETLWSPRTETVRLVGLPEEAVAVLVSAASGRASPATPCGGCTHAARATRTSCTS